ncbi:HWE histidine kinase domain-containing protein [Alteromonas sp. 009811495]|uniref:HWE histidine kinase domain-containing protein n=1 Tax=Alteromonas sp. 009811495 TaxID=3002962 RepID=UPI00237DA1D2|nr:HWE histidine kinase domain-containing protein [Alteromonas sp. 009811495]WDT85448.1 GAF domain-containing protein [Alteromonas sp. 009811495]
MQSNSDDIQTLIQQCDKEPIHLLGRIQPTGFLVAVDQQGIVTHASTNIAELFALSPQELLGTNLWERFDREFVHSIRGAQQQSAIINRACHIYSASLPNSNDVFDIAVHQTSAFIVIEFEKTPQSSNQDNLVTALMKQVSGSQKVKELNENVVEGVRYATGFDRVMLYQFLDDGSGEVVAESKSQDIETFMGLRYPASDIPAQARRLYKQNLIRHVVDVNADTPSIVSSSEETAELDLSLSKLRAVSEVHIQYLKNMGVGASMSISVIVDGELWGLIACHHGSSRHLPGRLLSQLELFGEMFSLELSHKLVSERIKISERANGAFTRVLSNLSLGSSLARAIVDQLSLIRSLIDIDGIGCSFSDEYTKAGVALSKSKVKMLTDFLSQNPNEEIYQLDKLVTADPRLSNSNVAGVLAIKISSSPMDFIFLYRTSVVQHVAWAGNPEKRVEKTESGAILTPRASFEKWLETNEEQSRVWSTLDLERAKSLRSGVMELSIRHLHEKEALQREAKKRLELLIGELNHRVRNILNLVSAIVGQTSQTKNDIESFVSSLSSRISALALGHDQLTHASWNSIVFKQLLVNELKAYMVNESAFTIDGPSIKLTSYAVTPIVLVFHEMITNAAKYGALSATSNDGKVSITWQYNTHGDVEIKWSEAGGPPIASIEKEGFGMTIIKSVIPHELGGNVVLTPSVEGLNALFVIPSKYVEANEDERDDGQIRVSNSESLHCDGEVLQAVERNSAYIVEDNLLISLNLQKLLKATGFTNVEIFGDVGTAKKALGKRSPQVVFLDVHLGSENTFPLGIELKERGIPFVFITGYGSSLELPEVLAGTTILTKPVDPLLLSETINAMGFETRSVCY